MTASMLEAPDVWQGAGWGEGTRELFGGAHRVCRGWSRQIGIQKTREEMGNLEQRAYVLM